MSTGSSKFDIQIETPLEQQENLKMNRRVLHTLQKTATDKENLVGRMQAYNGKEVIVKPTEMDAVSIQKKKYIPTERTSPSPKTSTLITEKDLTSDTPSENYWRELAETRRVALNDSLIENQVLHEKVHSLKLQLNASTKLIEESREVINMLREMLENNDSEEPTDEE